jgi:hypothetical protein
MKNYRKTAIIVGILFIIGTVSGIFSQVVTAPIMGDAGYPLNIATNENRWVIGSLLILVMGLPLSMIPAMLYPIFKQYNEPLAIGAILFRGVLEAVTYVAMTLVMLSLLSVSQAYIQTGTTAVSIYQTASSLLINANQWIEQLLAIFFTIGAMMIYYLCYRMRLVPRWLSGWGFVGAVLYFFAPFISMLGPQHLALSLDSKLFLLMAPLALQEMVFAIWLIVKGFNPQKRVEKSA